MVLRLSSLQRWSCMEFKPASMNSRSIGLMGSLLATALSLGVLLRLWRSADHSPSGLVWDLSQRLSAFAEDREIGVVDEEAVALPAGDLPGNAQVHQGLQGFGGRGEAQVADGAEL